MHRNVQFNESFTSTFESRSSTLVRTRPPQCDAYVSENLESLDGFDDQADDLVGIQHLIPRLPHVNNPSPRSEDVWPDHEEAVEAALSAAGTPTSSPAKPPSQEPKKVDPLLHREHLVLAEKIFSHFFVLSETTTVPQCFVNAFYYSYVSVSNRLCVQTLTSEVREQVYNKSSVTLRRSRSACKSMSELDNAGTHLNTAALSRRLRSTIESSCS